jgi:two-component system chemotaxis response regulator CheY
MGFTVLIVDDSSTVRKIIRRCLQQSGLGIDQVLEGSNGQEALAVLEKQAVNVVLTDINMPVMDGVQLLSAIRQSQTWKAIPVLMITTEAGAEAVVDAVARGATGYVKKPFTPAEICDQLAPILKTACHA